MELCAIRAVAKQIFCDREEEDQQFSIRWTKKI